MGISMDSLMWGLMMMVVGMGAVFALLLALMLVLMGIGRLDRQEGQKLTAKPQVQPEDKMVTIHPDSDVPEISPPPKPAVRIIADGLDEHQVAAITVAVMTHAETRRRMGGRETRAHDRGSQLFASRWLSVGRGNQNNPFSRR